MMLNERGAPGTLHHIEFYVNDLGESLGFWSWFLSRYGYEPVQTWGEPGKSNAGQSWQRESGPYLVFVQVAENYLSVTNNRQGQGFNHFAMWSFPGEDLRALADEIKERGAKILLADDKHVCFEAQDGIVLEVYRLS